MVLHLNLEFIYQVKIPKSLFQFEKSILNVKASNFFYIHVFSTTFVLFKREIKE